MSTPGLLETALEKWLDSTPNANAAAQLLVKKVAATGTLPAELTLLAEDPCAQALRVLLPEGRYTARRAGGRKFVFRIPAFEQDRGLEPGSIITGLAKLTGQSLENRREQRKTRVSLLTGLIEPYTRTVGLQGEVARRDLNDVQSERGRWWTFAANASEAEVAQEVERHWTLLARLEDLRTQTGVVRAVHLSREVCGDTHWFRPGTQPWRWVSEDLARHLPDYPQPSETLQGSEWHQKVLEQCGVCECLTSVRVLVFGKAELLGDGFRWDWPAEAAREGMPIWLSMAHLQRAKLRAKDDVKCVISVENETTFWDLLEQQTLDKETLLIYTEGQANRAVIVAIRQLAATSLHLMFKHQGDLDLPGIKIYHSLCQRSGIPIQADRMDVNTYRQHLGRGIPLSSIEVADIERELSLAKLPLQELLREILVHRHRIEQESLNLPSDEAVSNTV